MWPGSAGDGRHRGGDGTGSITVTGTTPDGPISGTLTSLRVTCGGTAPHTYASIGGLTMVGTTPAAVAIGGGEGGSGFFVNITTAAGSLQYLSTATTGLLVRSGSTVTYTATATDSTAAGTQTVMVSGTVTCGT